MFLEPFLLQILTAETTGGNKVVGYQEDGEIVFHSVGADWWVMVLELHLLSHIPPAPSITVWVLGDPVYITQM